MINLTYEIDGKTKTQVWVSENNFSIPKKVMVIDDTFTANQFMSLASQGVAFIWKGDFHNAKNLLQAVQRRIKKHEPQNGDLSPVHLSKEFYRYRQHQAHKAQILSRLLIQVEADYSIKLPRAPNLRQALAEAVTLKNTEFLVSLRELLGYVGAHEWRKKGISVPALDGQKIYAHYGVFSPVRGEYLDLIKQAPLPERQEVAFDIGTGTGVIAAILANRGFKKIIATDMDDRALECAQFNIKNLNLENQVSVQKTNLFPDGLADLVVCNPPWLPAKATSAIERAVYDDDSQMLKGFLKGVGNHLNEGGEAWLIISDLAQRLGLRKDEEIPDLISTSGLTVIECLKTQPQHSKAVDEEDALHFARSQEVTQLWKLKKS